MKQFKKLFPISLIPILFILLLAGGGPYHPEMRGFLAGKVIDLQGIGLAYARITLKSSNFKGDFKTNESGEFSVPDLPIGVYEITAKSKEVGESISKEVVINLGRKTYITIVIMGRGNEEGDLSARLSGPYYFRNRHGRVLYHETFIEDKFYRVDYTYDRKGRLETASDSLDQRWEYEYTKSGKISQITRTDGKRILFNYDKHDKLWKVDLPWGFKIVYERGENAFTKKIKKYPNRTVFQFTYKFDRKGNKIEVEEGSARFQYNYNDKDRLTEIINLTTGETNSSVVEHKGKVKNKLTCGEIKFREGRYEDNFYEYIFDERENVVYQRDKHNPVEVVREFNKRNLLIKESYFYNSEPVLNIEYMYDVFNRLIMKSMDNGIRYYYFRDKDGHLTHKIKRNMLTGEEVDGVSYAPYLSGFDQHGFELIKYKNKEKLFVRDAEGNKRYMIEIHDVLKYNCLLLQREVNYDGDSYQGIESVLSEILERRMNPRTPVFPDFMTDFFDLPLVNPALSGEGMATIQSAPSDPWVGCYEDGYYCPPQYSYCVDCGDGGGGGGDDPGGGGGGGGGGSSSCSADISGPIQLDVRDWGTYNLITNCEDPYNIIWSGGLGASSGSTSYSTYWDSAGKKRVSVTFETATIEWVLNPETNEWEEAVTVIGKNAFMDVDVVGPDSDPSSGVYLVHVSSNRLEVEPNQSCQIFVEVFDQYGEFIPGIYVSVSASGEYGSGGHAHNSTRKVGTFSNYVSNPWGGCDVTYTASDVCGRDVITAQAGGKVGKFYLTVRVPGLQKMNEGSNYRLIGQTSTHPSNHWGIQYTISALIRIANQYKQQFPGAPPLDFNDMSLPYGGLFDINGNWSPPHFEHKYGRNCDLRIMNIPAQNKTILEGIIQENGGIVRKEEDSPYGPHWHLTFY